MVKIAFVILVAFVCCNVGSSGKKSNQFTLHSSQTGDDYTIEFRKPKNFDADKDYTLVYIPAAFIAYQQVCEIDWVTVCLEYLL